MIKKITGVLIFMFLLHNTVFAAEFTDNSKIKNIVVVGSPVAIHIASPINDWNVTVAACQDVDEVIVLASSVPGYKDILATVLAAKIADAQVRFYGNCDSSNPSSPKFYANTVVLY